MQKGLYLVTGGAPTRISAEADADAAGSAAPMESSTVPAGVLGAPVRASVDLVVPHVEEDDRHGPTGDAARGNLKCMRRVDAALLPARRL